MAMLFERIESPGLAHYSYLLGVGGEAVVIDARRDTDAYVDLAFGHGLRISDVLETHRHEDFAAGTRELGERTGARAWHADEQAAYRFGHAVTAGHKWRLGEYVLEALATPGHTPGHVAYLLSEGDGTPWTPSRETR